MSNYLSKMKPNGTEGPEYKLKDEEARDAIQNTNNNIRGSQSASGNIISIYNAADMYAEEISVSVEPQQNLHGYDKPWVGGAGKNLLPLTISRIKALNIHGTWTDNNYVINGVTYSFDVNADGSITKITVGGNNTTSSNAALYMFDDAYEQVYAGTIYVSGSTNSNGGTCYMQMNKVSTSGGSASAVGTIQNNVAYEFDSTNYKIQLIIYFKAGVNANGFVYYPMISKTNTTDFEPYTNISPIQGYDIVSVDRCGKNLVDISTLVYGSISTTDGSNVYDGETTVQRINQYICVKPNAEYTISGLSNAIRIHYYRADKSYISGTSAIVNNGNTTIINGASFIRFNGNAGNFSNTFMIRLASDTDSTFAPFKGNDRVSIQLGNKNLLPMTVDGIKAANTDGTWSGNIYTVYGVAFTILTDENGNVVGVKANGTASGGDATIHVTLNYESLSAGKYIVNGSIGGSASTYDVYCGFRINGSATYFNSYNGDSSVITYGASDKIYFIDVRIRNTKTVSNQIFYPMLRSATVTDPTFSPYNPSLGGMVYGGQLTIKDDGSAVFVGDRAFIELDNMASSIEYNSGLVCWLVNVTETPKSYGSDGIPQNMISSVGYNPQSYNSDKSQNAMGVDLWGRVFVGNGSSTTKPIGQIVYELATPFTLTLSAEQLKLLQGTNNVWSNAGNVTLKYQPDNVIAEPKADVQRLRDDVDDRLMGNACINKFDENGANWKNGYFINSSGAEQYLSNYRYTQNYIEVEPNTTYSIQAQYDDPIDLAITVPFYDESKTFISRATATETTGIGTFFGQFTTPENCHYIRMSVAILSSRIQLEIGSFPTAYEEYYPSNRELYEMIKALQNNS